jgi:hypothetical protein
MRVEELKKALMTADDNAEVEIYDSDGNSWEVYGTHYFVGKKLFRINLY